MSPTQRQKVYRTVPDCSHIPVTEAIGPVTQRNNAWLRLQDQIIKIRIPAVAGANRHVRARGTPARPYRCRLTGAQADGQGRLPGTGNGERARPRAAVVRVHRHEALPVEDAQRGADRTRTVEADALRPEVAEWTRQVPGVGAPVDHTARVLAAEGSVGVGQIVEGDGARGG